MNNTELKPCPFCGGEAKIATYDWGYSVKEYWVYCSCGCELKKFYTKVKAAESWNTRKPMDNIVAELKKENSRYLYNSIPLSRCIDIVKAGGVE